MKDIMIVADYYLPGYKGGGPIRTIKNVTDWLEDEYAFYILTRDRDLGDDKPYPRIQHGQWSQVGGARVRYLDSADYSWRKWPRLLRGFNYDLLYLNSFFSSLTVKTLMARRFGQIPNTPVLLAPRGEFYPGALQLKSFKKKSYLSLVKWLNVTEDIYWQASSEDELKTILDLFPGVRERIFVAPNLNVRTLEKVSLAGIPKQDSARLMFLSRISRKKNLDFALKVLAEVQGDVVFDIYGPIEDKGYWRECESLMEKLPPNVKAAYKGPVPVNRTVTTFSEYHGFLFPTAGENYGHVIWEALYAGCLPIISDLTPWQDLGRRDIGWMMPLDKPQWFRAAIEEIIGMDEKSHQERAKAAHDYAYDTAKDDAVLEANLHMFNRILGS